MCVRQPYVSDVTRYCTYLQRPHVRMTGFTTYGMYECTYSKVKSGQSVVQYFVINNQPAPNNTKNEEHKNVIKNNRM